MRGMTRRSMIRVERVDEARILLHDGGGQPVGERVVSAGLRAPGRIDVGHDVRKIPELEMGVKEVRGALHLAAPNRRIAAVLATTHDDERAQVATLDARPAEERSDQRFVVGMCADPEHSLRLMDASNPRKKQYGKDKVGHSRVIRL